jgi:hypothetical protein
LDSVTFSATSGHRRAGDGGCNRQWREKALNCVNNAAFDAVAGGYSVGRYKGLDPQVYCLIAALRAARSDRTAMPTAQQEPQRPDPASKNTSVRWAAQLRIG